MLCSNTGELPGVHSGDGCACSIRKCGWVERSLASQINCFDTYCTRYGHWQTKWERENVTFPRAEKSSQDNKQRYYPYVQWVHLLARIYPTPKWDRHPSSSSLGCHTKHWLHLCKTILHWFYQILWQISHLFYTDSGLTCAHTHRPWDKKDVVEEEQKVGVAI